MVFLFQSFFLSWPIVIAHSIKNLLLDLFNWLQMKKHRAELLDTKWDQLLVTLSSNPLPYQLWGSRFLRPVTKKKITKELLRDIDNYSISLEEISDDLLFKRSLLLELGYNSRERLLANTQLEVKLIDALLILCITNDFYESFELIHSKKIIPDDILLLHFCAKYSAPKIANFLIQLKYDLNEKDDQERTPLMIAVLYKSYVLAKLFLYNNALVDCPNYYGCTPLIIAARQGENKMVKLLLEHRANINHHDKLGCTPLIWSGIAQELSTTKLLLSNMTAAR